MRVTIPNLGTLLAGVALLWSGGPASAGWVSIKNESRVVVILQDLSDNPLAKRGRAVRLLPGETYREYHPTAGEKRFQLLDARGSGVPLFRGLLRWPKSDVTLRVRTDESARLTVEPALPTDGEPAVVTVSAGVPKP